MNSERQNNNKKSRKTHLKKLYIDLHFNESNKYLIPYQLARFLAPMCLLYRQRSEIRSTLLKGLLLISVSYLYKRQPVHSSNQSIKFQTLHHGQDQRAVQGCQEQDCRPTHGCNGLQDHRQAVW